MSWDQRFFDPIMVPGGHKLVTLRDAAVYITKLPKAEHDADEWQARDGGAAAGSGARRADDVRSNWDQAGAQSSP